MRSMRGSGTRHNDVDPMIVKVQLHDDGPAVISNESGKVMMTVPLGIVSKRFQAKETRGYFNAEYQGGILEIGDRIPDPVPAW